MATKKVPRPRPPATLGASAGLWREVVEVYVLTRPELAVLQQACETLDRIGELEALVASDGTMTAGSRGQPILHPAIGEARQQRLTFGRLISQLGLPDPDGSMIRSPSQVRAARAGQARWRARARREGGA